MHFTKFCPRHTRYQAKKPPVSQCRLCQRAYDRERRRFKIVGDAASALSKLLDADVTLEAHYRREGSADVGLFISVQRITPEWNGEMVGPGGARITIPRRRGRSQRADPGKLTTRAKAVSSKPYSGTGAGEAP